MNCTHEHVRNRKCNLPPLKLLNMTVRWVSPDLLPSYKALCKINTIRVVQSQVQNYQLAEFYLPKAYSAP